MHPRISINTISSLAWPLADDLALLERLDAPAFGFPMLKIEADVASGIAAIRRSGRRVSCVAASSADASLLDAQDALAVLRPAIDTAAALGSPLCYFTSGRTPERMNTDDACAALVAALPASVAYAATRGVKLAVENNSVTTRKTGFVHTFLDSVRLAEEADVQICLELQNCWYERDLARQFREHVAHIGIVQVSDFRVGEPLRLNRCVPGDGSIPLAWLIERLLDAGYAGAFDLELIGPSIDAEGPESALRRATSWLGDRLTEYGA
ncbi:MAG: sugar phosphate isomerase/epimerase [Myxococcota bacterium]